MDRVPVTEAARLLGLSYAACRDRLLRGQLEGGRDHLGRLYVSVAAIERARAEAPCGADGEAA